MSQLACAGPRSADTGKQSLPMPPRLLVLGKQSLPHIAAGVHLIHPMNRGVMVLHAGRAYITVIGLARDGTVGRSPPGGWSAVERRPQVEGPV